ncbi:MAG: excinuclease ABC subunit UvrC, partial [Desulfobacterales bacterium]
LISKIKDFETIVTRTEKEALLLESNLIKRHRPRYNVVLMDDKRYPAIKLDSRHDFPNLTIVRKIANDGAMYFGPFSSANAVRQTLKVINRTFKLRKCKNREFSNRNRPCLHYQMGACLGPCVGLVDRKAYAQMVEEVILFLRGRTPQLIQRVRKRMKEAVDAQDYEQAAVLRDRMFALQKTIEDQVVVSADLKDRDVLALARSTDGAVVTLQTVRGGYLQGSRNFSFRNTLDTEGDFMGAFLKQYYDSAHTIPREILVIPCPSDRDLLSEWLQSRIGARVDIRCPARGAKRRLVDAARRNAEQELKARATAAREEKATLLRLQQRLLLSTVPGRIECYDNSNLAGDALVGVRVVFEGTRPVKKHYRTYRIDSVALPDDYGAMSEVLKRRFKSTSQDDLPDLLIVDGGKGQLNIAVSVIHDLGLEGQFGLAGIAKKDRTKGEDEDKVYLPGRSNPINLSRDADILFLIQRIRDEAHRFAIATHRKQRSKRFTDSELDTIPGVGPKRKRRLLAHFGSLEQIKGATVEGLTEVVGITPQLARRILNTLSREPRPKDPSSNDIGGA